MQCLKSVVSGTECLIGEKSIPGFQNVNYNVINHELLWQKSAVNNIIDYNLNK
jgi:hypothetical protein